MCVCVCVCVCCVCVCVCVICGVCGVMCLGSHVILACRALSAMVKNSGDPQVTSKLVRYLQECSLETRQDIMV